MGKHETRDFDELTMPEPNTGCLLWIGKFNKAGYGLYRGKAAHRWSWTRENGDIPDGLVVCHKCDTPSCVNAAHFFLGTIEENNRDAVNKGRRGKGVKLLHASMKEPQGPAFLCSRCGYQPPRGAPKKVDDVRVVRMRAKGKSLAEIAKAMGVTRGAIQAAIKRAQK